MASYLDRLKQASYESPEGNQFSFDFVAVAREATHQIGSFKFPGINGTLHQDKGVSGAMYPLQIFIHGADYDIISDAFFKSLLETGNGFLNHPRWGRKRVQIIGTPRQSEDLVNALGQAAIEVTFQETLEREFPTTSESIQFQIESLADEYKVDAVNNYADQIVTDTLEQKNSIKQEMLLSVEKVRTTLNTIASVSDTVSSVFNGALNDIVVNADEYVDNAAGFANSIIDAIRAPSTVIGRIDSKLQAYTVLFDSISNRSLTNTLAETKNSVLVDELIGTAAAVAVSESVNDALINTSTISRDDKGRAVITVPVATVGFQTRGEALAAAVYLRDYFASLVVYLDSGQTYFKGLLLSDVYIQALESYSPTIQVTSKVIKASLDLAFDLPSERVKVLQTDSTIFNECYELYGSTNEPTIDYFILTNALSGDEILLLPKGKAIVYYA